VALFGGVQQEKFASSYGTAAAILALHEQSALQPDRQQKRRLAAAVDRGADWLKSRVVAGRARWADYPAGRRPRRLPGVSGFALFALHRVGAWWLGSLDETGCASFRRKRPPRCAPSLGEGVQVGSRSFPDETRYYELPWMILATERSTAAPGFSESPRGAWLERALAPGFDLRAHRARKERDDRRRSPARPAERSEA